MLRRHLSGDIKMVVDTMSVETRLGLEIEKRFRDRKLVNFMIFKTAVLGEITYLEGIERKEKLYPAVSPRSF